MGIDSGGAIASLDNLRQRLALTGSAWLVAGNPIDRGFHLGGDCSAQPGNAQLTASLLQTVRATHLEVLSSMGCSVSVPQGTRVLEMRIDTDQRNAGSVFLRAGTETAEWAIDREDVAPIVSHRAVLPNRQPFLRGGSAVVPIVPGCPCARTARRST